MAIANVNAASATSTNWLKEAQSALAASENPSGLLGTLNDARAANPGSLKTFLAKSQNQAANLALISQSTQSSMLSITMQMAATSAQKRADAQAAQIQKLFGAGPTNYNPPTKLDSFVYFDDGTTIDLENNIMTKPDGSQFDTISGSPYHEPGSLIQMANGAYLDTKNNIMTMADGTKIDTITGLTITV